MKIRGHFLPLITAFCLSIGLPGASTPLWAADPRVVVIGSGISGLTALHRLKQQGINALLYTDDYRDGGRIRAGTESFGTDLVTNAGAELVDTTHVHVLGLMDEFHIQPLNRLEPKDFEQGSFIYKDEVLTSAQLYSRILEKNSEALKKLVQDQALVKSEQVGLDLGPRETELDKLSLSQYMESVGADDLLKSYVEAALSSETGTPAQITSAAMIFDMIGFQPDKSPPVLFTPNNDEAFRVLGGTHKLIEKLVEPYRTKIKRGFRLTAIRGKKGGPKTATFVRPDGSIKYVKADYFVTAIPFSELKKVDMSRLEGISQSTLDTIQRTTYGRHGKLILYFNNRLWLKRKHTGDAISDTGFQLWDSSQGQEGKAGSLTAYLGGIDPNANQEEELAKVMPKVEKLFPGITKYFLGASLYTWPASYSGSFAVGELTRNLAQVPPIDGLYFTGEHQSISQFGYMDGAIESAENAARLIARRIQSECLRKKFRELIVAAPATP